MSLKQRIEAIEAQITGQGTCATCGGLHTQNWVEAMRATVDKVSVCDCKECCGWLAALNAQALADSIPVHRQSLNDPKGTGRRGTS